MAKRPNIEMINAVHEVLAGEPGLSYTQIAQRLAERGYPQPPRQTVVSWVRALRRSRLVDERNISRVNPLHPAYLFLDLPTPAEDQVRRALMRHERSVQLEVVTGVAFNVVVRTQVRQSASLERLRRACLSAGAADARAAMVLRHGPPLPAASPIT